MVGSLSVIILAYNEEQNIVKSVTDISSVLKKGPVKDYEIIVVNDGSKDSTGKIAHDLIKKIPHLRVVDNNPNRGYGGSMKSGFTAAKKDFIAVAHADNQFDFSEVTKLIQVQESTDADIVSGIREGGGVDPFHRKLNRWGWNTVVRALFGYLATDIDCGFKLFRRSAVSQLTAPSERGAMIDTQLLASARARGLKVSEVPVTHLPRTAGKSTGANLQVIIQSFIDLFTFWWQLKKEILVERGLAIFPWEAVCLAVILVVAAFSRLYKIDQYMTFLGDEGRDALVMREMVLAKHFPLIGPGTSVGNMYLGPLYYYVIAPSLLLTDFSPVGPAIEVALIGIVTIALLWWVGRQWFGRAVALGMVALYALSPTVITYSRSSWNPNIMPFFALLSVYGIWKVWRYGYWRWLIISLASFGLVLNSHYLGLILAPVLGIFWFLAYLKTPNKNQARKATTIAVLLLLLLLSPLFFFDLRHHWQNYHALKLFFTNRETTVNLKAYKSIPNIWPLWHDIVSSLLAAKQSLPATILAIFIPLTTLIALVTKKISRDYVFVVVWTILGLIGLGLYKQHIYEHYYGFLFPVPFLLLGFCLKFFWKYTFLKPVVILVTAGLLVLNLAHSPLRYGPNNQLAHTQLVADFIKEKSSDQPFNLALISSSNYDASYRYFLELNDAQYYTIHEKLADQLFVVCETKPCKPIGHNLWEIAAFGWAKIDATWDFDHGVTLYRLVHNPEGK